MVAPAIWGCLHEWQFCKVHTLSRYARGFPNDAYKKSCTQQAQGFLTLVWGWGFRDAVTWRAMPAVVERLVGPPMPERSKGRVQTKRDTLVLQVGGWAWGWQPHPVKRMLFRNLTTSPGTVCGLHIACAVTAPPIGPKRRLLRDELFRICHIQITTKWDVGRPPRVRVPKFVETGCQGGQGSPRAVAPSEGEEEEAQDIQNRDNIDVRSIGQGEVLHRRDMKFKLSGWRSYDRSGVSTAVLASATNDEA
jgi:hypothetical protein